MPRMKLDDSELNRPKPELSFFFFFSKPVFFLWGLQPRGKDEPDNNQQVNKADILREHHFC